YFEFDQVNSTITRWDGRDPTTGQRFGRDWALDGFAVGQTIQVLGTPLLPDGSTNDGKFHVVGVSGNELELVAGSVHATQTTVFSLVLEDFPSVQPDIVVVTSSLIHPQLTFTQNTVTRSAGSWIRGGVIARGGTGGGREA